MAEGTPDPEGQAPTEPVVDPQDPGNQPPAGSAPTPDGGSEGQTSEEVARLRREAAGYRTQLRETQAKLKEFEDSSKTDLQKSQDRVQELTEDLTTMELRVRRSMVAALGGDVGIVKEARVDAAELLDWSGIPDPTDEKAVEKALRKLVQDKPYLLGQVPGGADGGAGGRNGGSTESMSDRIRAAAGRR